MNVVFEHVEHLPTEKPVRSHSKSSSVIFPHDFKTEETG